MRERWQIYQFTIETVPPGGLIGVPFQLDSDAPFALRRIKTRNIGLNGWRFQHPGKDYQSSFLRTDVLPQTDPARAGEFYPTHGVPVYPQSVYPANGQIVVDVGNNTGENLTNATFIFYGSKLFKDGALAVTDYPNKFAPLPFIYPLATTNNGFSSIYAPPVTMQLASGPQNPAVVSDLQLRVLQDADFVLRYIVADPFALMIEDQPSPPVPNPDEPWLYNWTDLRVLLKDESRKAYMNVPVNINDVFGQKFPVTLGPNQDNVGSGPIFPGLVTPELIVPREHSLYVDLYRYDETGLPVDVWVRFHGAKLFREGR